MKIFKHIKHYGARRYAIQNLFKNWGCSEVEDSIVNDLVYGNKAVSVFNDILFKPNPKPKSKDDPKTIILHHYNNEFYGNDCIVDVENINTFEQGSSFSVIFLKNGVYYKVKETLDEYIELLKEAGINETSF